MPCRLSAGLAIKTPKCGTPWEDSLAGQPVLKLCFALALSIALALCLAAAHSRLWLRAASQLPEALPLTEGPRPAPGAPWRLPRPAPPAQGRSLPMAPPSGSRPSLQAQGRDRALLLGLALAPFFSKRQEGLKGSLFHQCVHKCWHWKRPFPSPTSCHYCLKSTTQLWKEKQPAAQRCHPCPAGALWHSS